MINQLTSDDRKRLTQLTLHNNLTYVSGHANKHSLSKILFQDSTIFTKKLTLIDIYDNLLKTGSIVSIYTFNLDHKHMSDYIKWYIDDNDRQLFKNIELKNKSNNIFIYRCKFKQQMAHKIGCILLSNGSNVKYATPKYIDIEIKQDKYTVEFNVNNFNKIYKQLKVVKRDDLIQLQVNIDKYNADEIMLQLYNLYYI